MRLLCLYNHVESLLNYNEIKYAALRVLYLHIKHFEHFEISSILNDVTTLVKLLMMFIANIVQNVAYSMNGNIKQLFKYFYFHLH